MLHWLFGVGGDDMQRAHREAKEGIIPMLERGAIDVTEWGTH